MEDPRTDAQNNPAAEEPSLKPPRRKRSRHPAHVNVPPEERPAEPKRFKEGAEEPEEPSQSSVPVQGPTYSPHSASASAQPVVRDYVIQLREPQLPTGEEGQLNFTSLSNDATKMLEGKLSGLRTLTVGDYIQREKNNFVVFLETILPAGKQGYAQLVASTQADEFLVTIKRRVLPKKKDLDGVIYHILNLFGLSKHDLGGQGKDPTMAERRFQVLKKYLATFCALAERILRDEKAAKTVVATTTTPTAADAPMPDAATAPKSA